MKGKSDRLFDSLIALIDVIVGHLQDLEEYFPFMKEVALSEWFMLIMALVWGSWFVIFDPVSSTQAYTRMVFPRFWASVFFITTVGHLICIFASQLKVVRKYIVSLYAVIWSFVCLTFAFGAIGSHIVPTTALFSLVNIVLAIRIWGNGSGQSINR